MNKADELNALADRVEREKPSEALDCAVGAAAFPDKLGISDGLGGVRLADAFTKYADEDPEYLCTVAWAFDLPAYTTSLDAAVSLANGWCIAHLSELGGDGLAMCVLTNGTRQAIGMCLASPASGVTALARAATAAALRAAARAYRQTKGEG